jgi:hypothetical protein
MAAKKLLTLFCIFALAMLACGVTVDLGTSPSSTPTQQLTGADQVSTMVAQTLQALTQEALLATPTPTATATITNTPVPPTLSVSVATNCYAGPSTHYGFVITIYPGTTVTVVGKDPGDNYWVIDVPGYPGTTCWLSGQYASVSGDTTNLSVPATTTILYALSSPDHLRISCSRADWIIPAAWTPRPTPGSGTPWPHPSGTPWPHPWPPWPHNGGGVVFSWRNTDPDQTNVLVYRDGYRVATLGGGATSYTDDDFGGWGWHGWGVTYGVQAINSYAVSSIETISTGDCR